MDIVYPVQMSIVGTVKTKATKFFFCLNLTRRLQRLSLTLNDPCSACQKYWSISKAN